MHILYSTLKNNWVKTKFRRYFNFIFGFILLFIGLVGTYLSETYFDGFLVGFLPGFAGIGFAQICLGSSALVFHHDLSGRKSSIVILIGILTLLTGFFLLAIPLIGLTGSSFIAGGSGVSLSSYGVMILFDLVIATSKLRANPVTSLGLSLLFLGLAASVLVVVLNQLLYIYIAAFPLLSGGLIFFSVKARRVYGSWVVSPQ